MNPLARIALALALSTVALPVLAAPPARTPAAVSEKGGHEKFPMPAADFKKLVDQKIDKAKAKLEKHITKKKLSDDKAKALREKFTAAVAQINQVVDKVCADGTVTKEEAKEVHEAVKALKHHGHDKAPAKR